MQQATIGDLPAFFPILKEALELYTLPVDGVNPDYVLTQIHMGIERGICSVFVDDIGSPHVFALGVVEHCATWDGKICVVPLFYVQPDFRSPGLVREMAEVIKNYGREQGCKQFLSSSWKFRGLKNASDALWKAMGMEEHETIYGTTL